MDRMALRQALREVLEESTGQKYDALDDDQDLQAGLKLDSVDLVSLVIEAQRRFRINIANEELNGLKRVGQLLDLIQAKLADGQSRAA